MDDVLLHYLTNQTKRHRENLIRQARSLGEDMIRLADRLEKSMDASVSEIGEVQSRGSMIDARCGAYCEAVQAQKAYIAAAMDAQIGR